MVIVLLPTANAIDPDAEPLVTATEFTVTVENESDTVGVTVIELVTNGTVIV